MKRECKLCLPLDNTSPQIAAAYERLVAARASLLRACDHDRQMEVARMDESAWYAYEEEIVGKIECVSNSLEYLVGIRSQTINDLAIKIAATSRNIYATDAVKRDIEKDLEEITQISPMCLEVDAVRLKRPRSL